MDEPLDYRSQAEECRALARRTRGAEEREQLLNMAKTWEMLAADREAKRKRADRSAR